MLYLIGTFCLNTYQHIHESSSKKKKKKRKKRKKNANYKFDQALICSLSILVLTLKIDTHLSKFEASFQENF